MAKTLCEKCQAIREFIQRQRDNPPPMSFEVEGPFKDVLDGVEKILDHKSPLELAAEKAIKTGNHKDLKRYLTRRNDRE